MATSPKEFHFPIRDADVWGFNAPQGEERPSQEDISAGLEFNQLAVEDYLSNDLPTIYIQQSGVGTGFIDPTQLASGTPVSGYAPVYNGVVAAWTDVATQAELNAVAATIDTNATLAFQYSVTQTFLVMGA